MKLKELKGILKESIYILYKGKEEFFIPLKTNIKILSNHRDEVLWKKYGELNVKEIYSEDEMMFIEIE